MFKSWTYTCKTIIVIYLIISSLTMLVYTGVEVFRGNIILGAAMIASISTINASLIFVLKWLLHHERAKTK